MLDWGWKRRTWLVLSLAALLMLGLLALGGRLLHGIQGLEQYWSQHVEEHTARDELLHRLHRAMGYGGNAGKLTRNPLITMCICSASNSAAY